MEPGMSRAQKLMFQVGGKTSSRRGLKFMELLGLITGETQVRGVMARGSLWCSREEELCFGGAGRWFYKENKSTVKFSVISFIP